MADAQIRAVITAKDEASGVLARFGSGVGKIGEIAAVGLTAATAAVVAFGVTSVKAFSESEDLIAQTNAVLKSTGGIAGVTADQVTKLSKAFQATTTYSDEQVRSAENLLLTFTNISQTTFPHATAAVLDMSTALKRDLQTSAIQVGKALQDPNTGLLALRKSGVNLSEQLTKTIKDLFNTGHVAQAQTLILKELDTEFGGSAAAAAHTFSGQLANLKNNFDDVQEGVGYFIAKGLDVLVVHLNTFITSEKFTKWLDTAKTDAKNAGDALAIILTGKIPKDSIFAKKENDDPVPYFMAIHRIIFDIKNVFQDTVKNIQKDWDNLTKYFQENQSLKQFMVGLGNIFGQLIVDIRDNLVPAVHSFLKALGPDGIGVLKIFGAATLGIFAGVILFLDGVVNAITQVLNMITAVIRAIDNLKKLLFKGGIATSITNAVKNIIPGFAGGVQNFGGGLAIVGEQGPELVNLPPGSSVTPNNQIGGATYNISLNARAFMGSQVEARQFAQQIVNNIKDIAARKNMTGADYLAAPRNMV